MADPDEPPGGAEVDLAFRAVYGAQEPERRVPAAGLAPTGDAGLRAVSAWRGEDHWHLVTLGLTDGSAEGQAGRHGWRHELTVLTPPAERAADWAFALLVGVARTVHAAGRPLHAGARLAPGAPLDGASSELVALGVRPDPLVGAPPSGGWALLQLVGLTAAEFGLMRRVGTDVVLGKLAERDPLLRLDPARGARRA